MKYGIFAGDKYAAPLNEVRLLVRGLVGSAAYCLICVQAAAAHLLCSSECDQLMKLSHSGPAADAHPHDDVVGGGGGGRAIVVATVAICTLAEAST